MSVSRPTGRGAGRVVTAQSIGQHHRRLLANAERSLRETLPITSRFEPGCMARIDDPPCPPSAIREALANALCHRDYALGGGSVGLAAYDDRLEAIPTGTLHFRLPSGDPCASYESRP